VPDLPILTHEGIRQTAGERSYNLPKATQALLGPGLQSTARSEIPGNEAIRREGPTATLNYMGKVSQDQGFERAAMLGMLTNAAGEPLGGYEQAQWMLLANEGLRREAYTPPEGGKNVAFGLGETLTVEEGRKLGIIAGQPVPDKAIYSAFQKSFGRAAGHVEEWFPGMAQEDPTLFALLVDSTYRGSLGVATKTRKFIQEGQWEKAAREYLRGTGPGGMNKDYAASLEFERSWAARGKPKDSGIHVRMERLSDYLDAKAGQEKRARQEEFRKNIPPELGGNLPAPVVEPPPPDVQWDSVNSRVEVGPAALAGAAAFSFPSIYFRAATHPDYSFHGTTEAIADDFLDVSMTGNFANSGTTTQDFIGAHSAEESVVADIFAGGLHRKDPIDPTVYAVPKPKNPRVLPLISGQADYMTTQLDVIHHLSRDGSPGEYLFSDFLFNLLDDYAIDATSFEVAIKAGDFDAALAMAKDGGIPPYDDIVETLTYLNDPKNTKRPYLAITEKQATSLNLKQHSQNINVDSSKFKRLNPWGKFIMLVDSEFSTMDEGLQADFGGSLDFRREVAESYADELRTAGYDGVAYENTAASERVSKGSNRSYIHIDDAKIQAERSVPGARPGRPRSSFGAVGKKLAKGALRHAPGAGIFLGLTGAATAMGFDPSEEMPIPGSGNVVDRLAQKAIGAGIGLLPSTQTKKRKGETDRQYASRTIAGFPGD